MSVAQQNPNPLRLAQVEGGANHPAKDASAILPPLDEQRQRMAKAREVVAAMEAIENGPDEDDAEFFRALDCSRPEGLNLRSYYCDGSHPA